MLRALPVTSISAVVRSTTRSAGVVTSISTTLETLEVSVVRELVNMLSSAAVVDGNVSTSAVVSDDGNDLDELVVVASVLVVGIVVLLVAVILINFVLMVVVLLFVVLVLGVLLIVVELVLLVVVDEMLVVVVLVITGEEVVDLFGTGINTATELSSIIVGLLSVPPVPPVSLVSSDGLLFSRAFMASSMALVNAS